MLNRLPDLFKRYGANYFLLFAAAFLLSMLLYLFGIDSEIPMLFHITNGINGFTLLTILFIFVSAWKVSPFFNYIVLALIASLIFLTFNFLYYREDNDFAHLFSLLSQLVQLVSILMISFVRFKGTIRMVDYIPMTIFVTLGISILLISGKDLFTVLDQNGKPTLLDHVIHLLLFFIAMLAIVFLLKNDRLFGQLYLGCLTFSIFLKLPEQLIFLLAPSHESEFLLSAHVFRMFSNFSLLVVAYIVGISIPAKRAEQYKLESETNLNEMIQLYSQKLDAKRESIRRKHQVNRSVHDLKNPLSVIVGSLALLEANLKKESCLDPVYHKYFTLIENNNIQILTVLNQLTDTDDLIASKAPLYLGNYDIEELLYARISELTPYAERKKQTIKTDSMIAKKMIRCDREVVEQIIHNILVEAISFSGRNKTIHVLLEETDMLLLMKVSMIGHMDKKQDLEPKMEETEALVTLHQGSLSFQRKPDGVVEVLIILPRELTL